jgi:hypothetical protein
MSKESWTFLFAAISALGSLATCIQTWIQYRQGSPMNNVAQQPITSIASLSITKTRAFVIVTLLLLSMILSGIGFVQSLQRGNELNKPLRSENIEMTIKQWLFTFGYGFKAYSDIDYEFLLWVNVDNNKHVAVGRAKQYPQYITMWINLTIPDDIQQLLSKLTLSRQREIRRDLRIEMYKLQPEHAELVGTSEKTGKILNGLSFEKRLPITNAMTEDVFIKALVDMNTTSNLFQEILAKDIGQ